MTAFMSPDTATTFRREMSRMGEGVPRDAPYPLECHRTNDNEVSDNTAPWYTRTTNTECHVTTVTKYFIIYTCICNRTPVCMFPVDS